MNTKPNNEKKTKYFAMMMTQTEFEHLQKLASKNNMNMSQYMRQLLFISAIIPK